MIVEKIKLKKLEIIKLLIFLIIATLAVNYRLQFFAQEGKDIYAYQRAIGDFLTGVNPYQWTIESFSNPDDPGNHGFAYFPGLIYLFSPLYLIGLNTGLSYTLLWKIPVLLADIGVGILLFKYFNKKGILPLTAALLLWFFNPYSFFRTGYTYTEPITIFFMFLALLYLEKDDVLAGAFYGLSIVMKTFPYILFPVFLLKAGDKKKLILSMGLVGLFFSLPFMTSWQNLLTYIQGTLLVHGERFVQGRPFLYYISYFYNIEFFQIVPFKVYSLLAGFSGWVLVVILYFSKKVKDKFILALIPFLTFYLFTPVFNRTYFLWFLPIFLVAVYKIFEKKYRWAFYLTLILFFSFAGWYLLQWKDGFHIWHP